MSGSHDEQALPAVPTHEDAIPTPRSLLRSASASRSAAPPHPYLMMQASRLARLGFKDSDSFDRSWARAAHTAPHGGRGSAVTFHAKPSLAGGTVEVRSGGSLFGAFASLSSVVVADDKPAISFASAAQAEGRAQTPLFKRPLAAPEGKRTGAAEHGAANASATRNSTERASGQRESGSPSSSPARSALRASRSAAQSRGHLSPRQQDAPAGSAELSTLRRRAGLTAFAKAASTSGSAAKASTQVVRPFTAPRSGPAVPASERPAARDKGDAVEAVQGGAVGQSEALARQTVSLLTGGPTLQHELRVGGRSMPGNLGVQHGIRAHAEVYALPSAVAAIVPGSRHGSKGAFSAKQPQHARRRLDGSGSRPLPAAVRQEGVGLSALRDVESALFWSRRMQE
mgnify:CR=1 FL=1